VPPPGTPGRPPLHIPYLNQPQGHLRPPPCTTGAAPPPPAHLPPPNTPGVTSAPLMGGYAQMASLSAHQLTASQYAASQMAASQLAARQMAYAASLNAAQAAWSLASNAATAPMAQTSPSSSSTAGVPKQGNITRPGQVAPKPVGVVRTTVDHQLVAYANMELQKFVLRFRLSDRTREELQTLAPEAMLEVIESSSGGKDVPPDDGKCNLDGAEDVVIMARITRIKIEKPECVIRAGSGGPQPPPPQDSPPPLPVPGAVGKSSSSSAKPPGASSTAAADANAQNTKALHKSEPELSRTELLIKFCTENNLKPNVVQTLNTLEDEDLKTVMCIKGLAKVPPLRIETHRDRSTVVMERIEKLSADAATEVKQRIEKRSHPWSLAQSIQEFTNEFGLPLELQQGLMMLTDTDIDSIIKPSGWLRSVEAKSRYDLVLARIEKADTQVHRLVSGLPRGAMRDVAPLPATILERLRSPVRSSPVRRSKSRRPVVIRRLARSRSRSRSRRPRARSRSARRRARSSSSSRARRRSRVVRKVRRSPTPRRKSKSPKKSGNKKKKSSSSSSSKPAKKKAAKKKKGSTSSSSAPAKAKPKAKKKAPAKAKKKKSSSGSSSSKTKVPADAADVGEHLPPPVVDFPPPPLAITAEASVPAETPAAAASSPAAFSAAAVTPVASAAAGAAAAGVPPPVPVGQAVALEPSVDSGAAHAAGAGADEEMAIVAAPANDSEQGVWDWLEGLDNGRGSLLQYFGAIKREFDADFNMITAAKLPTPFTPGTLGSIDPSFFEALGCKPVGHRLLLAKGILALDS